MSETGTEMKYVLLNINHNITLLSEGQGQIKSALNVRFVSLLKHHAQLRWSQTLRDSKCFLRLMIVAQGCTRYILQRPVALGICNLPWDLDIQEDVSVKLITIKVQLHDRNIGLCKFPYDLS